MPKQISIIIPCYNVAEYIDTCLKSIINQTIGINQIQVIVVDDASTDKTAEQIIKYVKDYPMSIFLEILSENSGQANARNIGMDMAEAPYLLFVDADDWLREDFCEKMLSVVEKQECDLIQCGWISYYNELKQKENTIISKCFQKIYYIDSPENRRLLFDECSFSRIIGSSVLRTEFLRENGLRFRSFRKYEDNYFDSIIRFKINSYCSIPDKLYYYRILNESNSHSKNDEGHFVRFNVEIEKLNFYKKNNLLEIYYDIIRDEFLNMFYLNTLHIIFVQFDYIPMDIIKYMQSTVRQLFPDYLNGREQETMINDAVLTLAFDFPQEKWELFKASYLKYINNKGSRELELFYRAVRRIVEREIWRKKYE